MDGYVLVKRVATSPYLGTEYVLLNRREIGDVHYCKILLLRNY